MAFVLLPKRATTRPVVADSDPYHQRTWTRQPGHEGTLHISVGKLPPDADVPHVAPALGAADSLPSLYSNLSRVQNDSAIRLRDYQHEAIDAVGAAWDRGVNAPLIVMPTGSGKTIVAAKLMSTMHIQHGARCLFLAHRKELLDQTAEKVRLVDREARVGIVQAKRNEMGHDVTIASIQTIGHRSQARLQALLDRGPYDVVVCDEAHHAVSNQWRRVLDALREHNPEMRMFGMTATPGRADGTALDTVFDEVVYEKNLVDMIQLGYLVPPKGYKVTLDLDLDNVGTRNGDFVQSQLSRVMNTNHVNAAVVRSWCEYGHNRKTVVFAVDVAHAVALRDEYVAAGYAAEHIDGSMKARERTAVLRRFRTGETRILVNCEIATEGFDEPSIECVLFARPTQSQALYIQCLGRGLRLYPGKTECVVVDTVGNSDRHRPVQLASLAGFAAEDTGDGRGSGQGEEGEEEDAPTVVGADIRGEEVELTRRVATARYQWRETSLGWALQIPRIGYYLVAWHSRQTNRVTIRFYDQRRGRRDAPSRDIMREPIDFEMAFGMVESEMDRIFFARSRRDNPQYGRRGGGERREERDEYQMTDVSFVDLEEGTDEDLDIPEEWMLRDASWRSRPMTDRQRELLLKLGAKERTLPENMGEASDLISVLQMERDFKMRLPATPKQIAYLKVNGIPFPEHVTKGACARLIWRHRKAHQ